MKKKKQDLFLKKFAKTGTILSGCKDAGIARTTFYDWKKNDKAFAKRFEETDLQVTETLEESAMERALGKSDTLCIFLLKSRRPDTYRDRMSMEHSGEVKTGQIDLSQLSKAQLEKLAKLGDAKKK